MKSIFPHFSRSTLLAVVILMLALFSMPHAEAQSSGDVFSKKVGDWFRRNLYGETNPGYGPRPSPYSQPQAAPQQPRYGNVQPPRYNTSAPTQQNRYGSQAQIQPQPQRPMGYPQAPVYQTAPPQGGINSAKATSKKTGHSSESKPSGKKRSYTPPKVKEEEPPMLADNAGQTVVKSPATTSLGVSNSALAGTKRTSSSPSLPATTNAGVSNTTAASMPAAGAGLTTAPTQTQPQTPASSSTPPATSKPTGPYPIGSRTDRPGRVLSPFPPNIELNVEGMASGSLALDPTSNQVFRIP